MTDNRALYDEALRRGHSYSWDQHWQEAIREFELATQQSLNEPAPYAGLGMAYFELGDLERALENYKLAARLSHGDMIYLKHVADVQERLGYLNEAGQTYLAIAELQLRRNRLDESVANWQRAVRLEPGLVGAHQRLAAVYQKRGLIRDAIREYLAIARILYNRGEREKAVRACEAAINLDPRNPDALTALELIRQGETFLADEDELLVEETIVHDLDVPTTVRRVTTALEAELVEWQRETATDEVGPVTDASRYAREQLAEEIFAEEEDEAVGFNGKAMSKLERDALVSQALDFQTRRMFDEAVSCFRKSIDGGVDSPSAHFLLGLLYKEQHNHRQAVRELEKAANDSYLGVASHYVTGEVYRDAGQLRDALEHYIVALMLLDMSTVRPQQRERVTELYRQLSESLLRMGETESAARFIEALEEFLSRSDWRTHIKNTREKLDKLSAESEQMIIGDILVVGSTRVLESLFLSREYGERGIYGSAIEEVYRAIQLSPNYLPAHLHLGELLARQGRTEVAVSKFVIVGNTFRMRGDVEGAINTYERALSLSPLEIESRVRLIDLLKKENQLEAALHHYLSLGEAYYNLADVEKARETYLEAIKVTPVGREGQVWRKRLLRRIADIDMQRFEWKKALAAYSELRAIDPEDDNIARTIIDLGFKTGRPDFALRQLDEHLTHMVRNGQGSGIASLLEDMIEQRPAEPGLVNRLSRLYVQFGRIDAAVQLLDRLSEAQLDAGESEEALKTIRRILQLNPTNVANYRELLQRLQEEIEE